MHPWKKKFVVSQLALACTLAITSQASAFNDISGTNYTTFKHYNDASYADGVYYNGYVGWNNYAADSVYNGDIYPVMGSEEKSQPSVNAVCGGQSGSRCATGRNSINNVQDEVILCHSLNNKGQIFTSTK